MVEVTWGLLGPEMLNSERRTRTLGLGAAVRRFNDLAVPGLGGVWFGKQLFWPTLGVAIAAELRRRGHKVQNIEVANSVEALACWLAIKDNSGSDPRLRGTTKMQGKTDPKLLRFAALRKGTFYVTIPMRMATVQALPALGLVAATGERFNSFSSSSLSHDFISKCSVESNPCYKSQTVLDYLTAWVSGTDTNFPQKLKTALSPLQPLPAEAREYLRERLIQGADNRRREALEWVDVLRKNPRQKIAWDTKPTMIHEKHWDDMHSGALFFATRDAAMDLLNQIEAHIAKYHEPKLPLDKPLPEPILDKIDQLRQCAQTFLNKDCDSSPRKMASEFCLECTELDNKILLQNLVKRDNRVLQNVDGVILPAAAFRKGQGDKADTARSAEDDGAETPARRIELPDGISYRISNLFLLNLDLHGELTDWLREPALVEASAP